MDQHGVVARVTQRIAGTRAFAKLAPPVVTRLDRVVHKLTRGRRTLSKGMVPILVLTATGARSGEPRVVPLACLPEDDHFYLVGSNFGRERHPAWTANLAKTPEATVSYEGETFAVVARRLSDDEKAAVWPRLLEIWPNYDRYEQRSGRNIRVFRLDRT
jgi:deazaflavin-dependent oxidoreductase (nitroreductase family)